MKGHKFDEYFTVIGNLIEEEGPLLCLLGSKGDNDNLWLCKWMDCDESTNQWMLFRINERYLRVFFHKKISLRKLINQQEVVTLIDLDNELTIVKSELLKPNQLDCNTLPNNDSFYDKEYYTSFANDLKIKLMANRLIMIDISNQGENRFLNVNRKFFRSNRSRERIKIRNTNAKFKFSNSVREAFKYENK